MKKLIFGLSILAAAMLVIPQITEASPLVSGITNFAVPSSWSATVNWEVYAPGVADGRIATDTDYHYWYYVTNTTPAGPGVPALSSFTVGNPIGAIINLVGSVDRGAGTPAPFFAFANPTSIVYQFVSNPPGFGLISPGGGSSDWLYYTSPVPPAPVSGGLIDGGKTDYQLVPGPAPEPASMALLGLGLLGLGGSALRKRFTA